MTPETKDSIDEVSLMTLPKGVTLINMACLQEVLEAQRSQRENRLLSHLRRATRDGSHHGFSRDDSESQGV